ncbi:MAG: tetratricopeptide repeat protein [Pseudomonadota bacterium]
MMKRHLIGRVALAVGLAFVLSPAAHATATTELRQDLDERDYPLSFSGSYLAALTAGRSRDLAAAALYFDKALEADPENLSLIERTFMLKLADGNVTRAIELSDQVISHDDDNRFARLALGVFALKQKSYKKAVNQFEKIEQGPLARLTGTLLKAWTLAGDGDVDTALETIDQLSGPVWYESFKLYHTALIAEVSDRGEVARASYEAAHERDPNVLRTAEAWARFQLRNDLEESGKEAVEVLARRYASRPSIKQLMKAVEDGMKPKPMVTNAMQGAMEVLYGLGTAIGREGGEEISHVYLNLAAHLQPENALPRLALGDLLEQDKRYQKAIDHYAAIPEASIHYTNALISQAFAQNSLENLDQSRAIMDELLEKEPENLIALASYGNILRSHELYAEAGEIYARAISLLSPEEEARNWSLFYSRGITHERIGNWPEAEADFRKALVLRPNHPQVLNYLGYSLIDRDMKYEEALEMIREAVRQRPNDAYIIDSLGWAYYKLERFEKAVEHLERAVELRPHDPILNDHLGDAYWQVGRKLEAVFQWSHARDLDPEEKDLEKIVRKIENGLSEDDQDG